MKIYKEVVYQVAGNKLVRVYEDSFEYSGEVTECKSSGGDVIEDIADTEVDLDPRTSDTGNVLGDGTLGQNVGNIDLDPRTSDPANISDLGTPNIPTPNMEQFGTGHGGTMGDIFNATSVNMQNVNQFINQKLEELSEFLNPSGDTPTVTVDPDQSAYSGLTANKKAAELAANKAKAQARSSLRINA